MVDTGTGASSHARETSRALTGCSLMITVTACNFSLSRSKTTMGSRTMMAIARRISKTFKRGGNSPTFTMPNIGEHDTLNVCNNGRDSKRDVLNTVSGSRPHIWWMSRYSSDGGRFLNKTGLTRTNDNVNVFRMRMGVKNA